MRAGYAQIEPGNYLIWLITQSNTAARLRTRKKVYAAGRAICLQIAQAKPDEGFFPLLSSPLIAKERA